LHHDGSAAIIARPRNLEVGQCAAHRRRKLENARVARRKRALIEELGAHYPPDPAADCVVCPPLVYLQEVGRMLRDTPMHLGAQDVCADNQGAFTGEVSSAMLKDVVASTRSSVTRSGGCCIGKVISW